MVIACLCLLFFGCKSNKKAIEINDVTSIKDDRVFIKGHYIGFGNEPFWRIEVENDSAEFVVLNEKIDTVFFKLIDFEDIGIHTKIDVTLIDSKNDTASLIFIKCNTNNLCSDGMSDKLSEYSAEFNYNNKHYKGCRGSYGK